MDEILENMLVNWTVGTNGRYAIVGGKLEYLGYLKKNLNKQDTYIFSEFLTKLGV